MALLDKVSGELQLYIGGLFTLRRKESLRTSGITHVLSVLRFIPDQALFDGFEHHVVEVDDVDDENLLEHFPACNKFIQQGLDGGGGVLVHCAMGKSRSATAVCAFLMQRYGVTPDQALAQIRETRPLCEPNEGFWKQLELYHSIATPEDIEETPAYQRWLYQRELELSRACAQAPEAEKIRFEDEHEQEESAGTSKPARSFIYRILPDPPYGRTLATSQYLNEHRARDTGKPSGSCSHYFLDPLSWMRKELEQGKLDGRLECPKCQANVGKYAWQGMQCSCGDWVVPGISLAKGRIDEVKSRPLTATGLGIRQPPQAVVVRKTGSGHENL
ncbi:hypothetical protein LTR62_007329 [Meristemomyces frigidus]|uniref:protein-tyrosine-phosphatase n=1 Tax=Meristemomyces frigidus TaxID=1508187 RepID=A0AAN7YJ44_9PEZI|nr:hypothetical protein LTR62_007329 [Meristemomyces frigidus]